MNMVPRDLLTRLCPMHVALGAAAQIVQAGPTLRKLRPDRDLTGIGFLDLFEVHSPRGIRDMAGLLEHAGRKLHLRFRDAPHTALKGLLVADGEGGAVVDLSFGISVVDAVRVYRLTSADFAATDLTIEMLYLVEAQSAAMSEQGKLNQRLQGAMIAAEQRAFTDTLTGLRNRRAVDQVLERLEGTGRRYALLHLDLDFFKAVNDTMGHAAGDFVLQQVARVLLAETRNDDIAARIGGDEFVVVLDGGGTRDALSHIARRIIQGLEVPMEHEGRFCRISGSIGISTSEGATRISAAQMMARADIALYASKRGGRGRHAFFEPEMGMAPTTDRHPFEAQ